MDQSVTPYADALNAFGERDLVRASVPGHGAEGGVPERLRDFISRRPFHKDVTPLTTGLDKGVTNPLDTAKKLAADAWSARRAWFLTNGASQGNRVAALALAGRARHVMVQRSTHSSFLDGLILSGLMPDFIMPSIDTERGIAHGVSADSLETALRATTQELAGVYVISPSYFGAVSDIEALGSIAHAHGVPLIVDAAWGAHFGFSQELPKNPITLGADLVISSTHKLGGSLTQSAMLHLAEGPFADELEALIDRAFGLTQSTSENTWLLASLDIARHALVNGAERIQRSVGVANELRELVRRDALFELVEDSFSNFPDIVAHDPLRIAIDISRTGISGHELKEAAASEFGVYFEVSTQTALVALIGPGATPDVGRIIQALQGAKPRTSGAGPGQSQILPAAGPVRMSPRDAFFGKHQVVAAKAAVGRISADMLAAYPPGIPNLMPGEVITAATLDFLDKVARSPGGFIRGSVDRKCQHYRVVVTEPTCAA